MTRFGTPLVKTAAEIAGIAAAGKVVAEVLELVAAAARPGVRLEELDALAYGTITARGARPSFLGYRPPFARSPYPASLCLSVNEVIVHGIPDRTELAAGDVLAVDCGACLEGFHADAAVTVAVGEVRGEDRELIEATRTALAAGVGAARAGNRLTDISHAIGETARRHGLSAVADFGGHGVGRALHEDPHIPNEGPPGRGPALRAGMVLALEPILARGGPGYRVRPDGWTIVTADGSRTAHFEHTVAVTAAGPRVLTG